jgi:hypothetical protein
MAAAQSIGSALDKYAADNGGQYPDGSTSTEIFQKLLDKHYLSDPSLFYLSHVEKSGEDITRLKPESVCWDVTCCVDGDSPDNVPVLFLTGYKVTYDPKGNATLIDKFDWSSITSWKELLSSGDVPPQRLGIFIHYKNKSTVWKIPDNNGNIPDFISGDFDAKGKVYHQLTPVGQ